MGLIIWVIGPTFLATSVEIPKARGFVFHKNWEVVELFADCTRKNI
jgi:hypothetical protein